VDSRTGSGHGRDVIAQPREQRTAGLQAVRSLRERVRTSSLREATREHIDFILSKKEEDFVDALKRAFGVSPSALHDRGQAFCSGSDGQVEMIRNQ